MQSGFRFTLDMNCLIDLDEDRPSSSFIRKIVDAHQKEDVDVAVLAIGASERQMDHGYLSNSADYYSRLDRLGVGHLRTLLPMAYFDVTFLDGCLMSDGAMTAVERQVHEILFPNVIFNYGQHCQDRGIDELPVDRAWRNVKCDVQAMWCHLHYARNVFVTSDKNFLRKSEALIELGAGNVLEPAEAAKLL